MPNQHIQDMLNKIQQFLSQYQQLISTLSRLRKPSTIYECYSISELAIQLNSAGWTVNTHYTPNRTFIFKTSTQGNPNNYSYLTISKNGYEFEVRQNLPINGRWGIYTPDICIIQLNSLRFFNNSLPNTYLENFIECKHMKPSPMSCASFIGMLYVFNRWGRFNRKSLRKFPAMIFYSNFGSSSNVRSIIDSFNGYRYRKIFADAVFDGISPNSPKLTDLRNYLQRYP